jgi:hypothetical protein
LAPPTELPVNECLQPLELGQIGRIAFVRDEQSEILPTTSCCSQGTVVIPTLMALG